MRQYTKVNKGKQVQTPEMLEAQPVTAVPEEPKDEIPFGIRAIQSGIEVDGVWISRSNTPVGSSRASVISDKMLRGSNYGSYNNSALELPKTAVLSSSRDSSRAPSSAFDRAVSAERIPTNNGSRASSPGRGSANQTPRCSNCNHHIAQNSSALQGFESSRAVPASDPPSRKLYHSIRRPPRLT